MDSLTPEERSALMSKIRGKNTNPERIVRAMLHRAGYRFSLHRKDLPGKPDIVLRKYKSVVFVHGCFWHRHKNCKIASMPKSNVAFWQAKFDRNVANDQKHRRALKKLGWNVIVVWECELKKPDKVLAKLQKGLNTGITKVIHYPTARASGLKAAEKKAEYRTGKRGKEHKR
jgi:DNA mismatch endonuclease (patch repair protein)